MCEKILKEKDLEKVSGGFENNSISGQNPEFENNSINSENNIYGGIIYNNEPIDGSPDTTHGPIKR